MRTTRGRVILKLGEARMVYERVRNVTVDQINDSLMEISIEGKILLGISFLRLHSNMIQSNSRKYLLIFFSKIDVYGLII